MKKRLISLLLTVCMVVGLGTGMGASAKELGTTNAAGIGAESVEKPVEEQKPFKVYPVSYTHLDVYKRQASFAWQAQSILPPSHIRKNPSSSLSSTSIPFST